MKRVISLFMAVLLFISTVPISNVMAAADVTKPVFESISVDKKEVGPGDTVKISVNVTDDVGIQSVYLYYTVPGTDTTFNVPVSYHPETDTYEGSISIPSNFATGVYQVSYINIRDTSNNQTLIFQSDDYEHKFDNGSFTVTGTSGADTTKPVFESISVDKWEAGPGDTVNVSVKTSDDFGIKSVYLYYTVPGTDTTFNVPVSYHPETDTYEGSISIPSNFAAGVYKVSYINIRDTSNNQTLIFQSDDYQNKFDNGSFTVSGTSGADITKPTFESMTVDKKEATFGDQVKVSLKITDDFGIKSVYLYYQVPGTDTTFNVPVNYNSETDSYEGIIPISSTSAAGVYSVSYVNIRDTSNNQTLIFQSDDYLNKFDNGEFRVFNESNPPTFSKLSIDKNLVESGDSVHITVDAKDDTNLQEGVVTYISPINQSTVTVPLSYSGSQFIGSFSIDNTTEVGNWKVKSIELKDSNLNSTVVKADETDLSVGDFTVLKGVEPLSSYVVTSYETWSNKTVNSDVYITPGARLTINSNVTINGNVYVLGGLRSYGGLTVNGTVSASFVTFGYYTPTDGQAIFSGSNTISSLRASNRVMESVPFNLYDTPLVSSGGRVNLTGATLPFVAVEVNGQSVSLKENGTFRLNDFYIGNSTSISVKLTDLSGYTYYHSYDVSDLYVDDFTKDSTALSGKTLANAVVKVFEDGRELASGQTDGNGYFSIPVDGLVENTTLKFEVWNAANELTTSKEIFVKDLTAPGKPVLNGLTDRDTAVTGQAEPKAAVEVRSGESVIGTGTVAEDGTFAVEIPKQRAGSWLSVTVKDTAGNVSEAATVLVLDVTDPPQPVVFEVTDADSSVKGQAEAKSTIMVSANGTAISWGVAAADGTFEVEIPVQPAGTEIVVKATDNAGNVSEAASVVVTDGTAPGKPVVGDVTDQDTEVSGRAEAGSKVEVTVDGSVIGSVVATMFDLFTVAIPAQKEGTEIVVTATDKAGNVSEAATVVVKDGTAPRKPVVSDVTDQDTGVTGTAEAGSKVAVRGNGSVIGSDTVSEDGTFTVAIPVQKEGTEISVTATDKVGNVSETATVVVKDGTAPRKPVIGDVTDQDTAVRGTAEAGSSVKVTADGTVIGSDSADDHGYFSIKIPVQKAGTALKVTAEDLAGNVSDVAVVVVSDVTKPEKPVVHEVTDKDTAVSGQGEAGAAIVVTVGGSEIGSGTIGENGAFTVAIPVQTAGTELTVVATDKAGNVSEATVVVVKDGTNPEKPIVDQVLDKDEVVTGKSEPGAKMIVTGGVDGTVIGSVVAGSEGYFTIKIPKQKAGTELAITATDKGGNVSEATFVVVKDGTAPVKPVIDGQVTDQTTTVKGSTEAGSKVDVFADDRLIGSGVAGDDGRFAVGIPKQKGGVDLFVTATDAVGNVSYSAVMTLIDVTAPEKPIVNEVNDRATVMTGQAEAGTYVEVSLNNFNVIGNGLVGEDGRFSVKIATQPVGTEITVTVSDGYGNLSPAAKVTVVKAKSGWVWSNGKWYYYDPATFVKKVGWYKVGSSWYYSDSMGAMKTGWVKAGSSWYFMNSNGAMVTGWLKVGTVWYFFKGSGVMATGWMKSGSVWYFFADNGAMKTGWLKSGTTWYYLKSSGAMQVGWLKVGTVWYYFNSGGAMVTGTVRIGGKTYYFDGNGVWIR
ncbi:Ig-like domain-containing protein [Neobacillus rhizosphaerae]|uniref:Ig-like domain-containing protein n=1 Tax=Neobacillus rhizosphaerae TaxID=2880965 RepID=UPI003D287CFF